ncbi:Hypothetical protein DEACI_0996 [Acididesulfobacillus acetoxydans]|uniref:Uncharacterized protein n=1 Tax=Acididesulfobacillus acetoxydans TaxID=1561005 RepID=A0A8S0VW26_9FIRM|nr:Hypothetical protein DEACI_0996 [Acididesulfobacillus acetoxydans]CEJ07865.1 Hypothetical protein DEACI_2331 [Acididesulfobacillus acetoxydans]
MPGALPPLIPGSPFLQFAGCFKRNLGDARFPLSKIFVLKQY